MRNIKINVRYYSLISAAIDYRLEETVCLPENSSILELLQLLCRKYGQPLENALFQHPETLSPACWVLLNGERVRKPECLILKENTKIILTSPLLVGG